MSEIGQSGASSGASPAALLSMNPPLLLLQCITPQSDGNLRIRRRQASSGRSHCSVLAFGKGEIEWDTAHRPGMENPEY